MTARRIEQDWADGTYVFELLNGGIQELQNKTGIGAYTCFRRMLAGDFMLDDIRETIRIGLIGGGLEPVAALRLVRQYIDERPLLENTPLALAILSAALVTPEGDEPKKANRRDLSKTMDGYVSPNSMQAVQ